MTSFVNHGKYVYDVESEVSYIEFTYDRNGLTFTDYISTKPLGDWSELELSKNSVPYEKFLDTMVEKTLEVYQRMSELELERILSSELSDNQLIRIANAVKILNPTFQPPRINKESAWQVECIREFSQEYIPHSIEECTNKSRLRYFINVLRTLELKE